MQPFVNRDLLSRWTGAWTALAVILVLVAAAPATAEPASRLIVYPYLRQVAYSPSQTSLDAHRNDDFTVQVRVPGGAWQDLYVHNVTVNWHNPQNASMAYFDFSGRVEIAVEKNNGPVSQVRVRPTGAGIKPVVTGNIIRFTLDKPADLSIEFDNDRQHNLHLFAGDAAMADRRPVDGPSVVYFGPGIHHAPSTNAFFPVSSGQTIYLDGGAILEGAFNIENVHDVSILGHGLIENPLTPIRIFNSQNIRIDGPTVVDPAPRMRSLVCSQSQHVYVNDFKSFSSSANGDGINVDSCEDVVFDHVFMRNSDDCIAIYTIEDGAAAADTRHIVMKNSTLWADVAHAMFIGINGNPQKPQTIEDVTFRNIDVLGLNEIQPDYQGVMAISAGNANLVRNVTFEDIRVDTIEDGKLFNFVTVQNQRYNQAPGQGIDTVSVRNVSYTGNGLTTPSIIRGFDAGHVTRNITLSNVTIAGKALTGPSPDLLEVGPFAEDVSFK